MVIDKYKLAIFQHMIQHLDFISCEQKDTKGERSQSLSTIDLKRERAQIAGIERY